MSGNISRRRFVAAAGSATAAGALLPNSAIANGIRAHASAYTRSSLSTGKFPFGVVSGEPTTAAITLCTTVDDFAGTGGIAVEISTTGAATPGATADSFGTVLKSVTLSSVAGQIYTVGGKARQSFKTTITGLAADTLYYYRFVTSDNYSRVGRFRTAPTVTSTRAVKYAFFSCQDYTFGYFNAHGAMAREDDLDFVVNLGDYIYAETYHGASTATDPYGTATGVRDDGIGESVAYSSSATYKVAKTLNDYRAKYDLYRADQDLQDMHAKYAMYSTWDDHEVMDNYAGGAGANGGLDPIRNYATRKVNGYKAFFEKMPTANQTPTSSSESKIYRSVRYGAHIELFLLDQRQYREDQPDGDPGLADPTKWNDWKNPRKFLGTTQLAWFKSALKASTATWKVVANEVMIMNTKYTSSSWYNFDSWQGYPAERMDLIKYIRTNNIKNVIFNTGDIHLFAAGDVVVDPLQVANKPLTGGLTTGKANNLDGKPVATEFVSGSITSQGLGDGGLGSLTDAVKVFPKSTSALYGVLFSVNPWLANGDVDRHGYAKVTASSTGYTCGLQRVPTIKRRTGVNGSTLTGSTALSNRVLSQTDASKTTNGFRGSFSWTVVKNALGLS